MGMDALLTLMVLIGAVALFVSEKLPVDIVALLVLVSLLGLGLVTPAEALSGFSSEATITVAAMFILSAGLAQTGALSAVSRLFSGVKSPGLLILLVMLCIGLISAFVNNTAAVAVFLPMVLAATAANRQSPSQILIPMSYAAQMGGVCTLIGTSTNLLVNSLAIDLGHSGFGLFDFAPLGLITMAVGFIYILLFRRWLLPMDPPVALHTTYQLAKYLAELRVSADSPLLGKSLWESQLEDRFGIALLKLLRRGDELDALRAEALQTDDLLLVHGEWKNLQAAAAELKLELKPELELDSFPLTDGGQSPKKLLVEAMILPGARLIGHSLSELNFHRHYHAAVLGLHRRGEVLSEQVKDISLNVGDILLLLCDASTLEALRQNRNLVVLQEREAIGFTRSKAVIAIAIMIAVVLTAAMGWMSIVAASILGGIALIATRCIGNDQAYRAIDWKVIVLLAGVLPLGIAMQKSGLADGIAGFGINSIGDYGPLAMLAGVYLGTALLTEMMSNNAAAVLVTPIAYSAALALGVSPTPFLVAVLFAASTSFATPVGYQTNTMVYNAGNYQFKDFMKMGIPLNLIFWALAVYFIPRFFPF